MKKYIWLVIGIFLLLFGCVTQGKLIKDEVSDEYLEKTYGIVPDSLLYFMPEDEFNRNKIQLRASIIEDESLSELEKEAEIEYLENIVYEEKKILVYFFRLGQPTLNKNLELQISVTDAGDQSWVDTLFYFSNKIIWQTNFGSTMAYYYVWLMELVDVPTKESLGGEPLTVIVTFPNGQSEYYQISP